MTCQVVWLERVSAHQGHCRPATAARTTASGGSALPFSICSVTALFDLVEQAREIEVAGSASRGALRRLSQVAFDPLDAESDDEQVEGELFLRAVEIIRQDFQSHTLGPLANGR